MIHLKELDEPTFDHNIEMYCDDSDEPRKFISSKGMQLHIGRRSTVEVSSHLDHLSGYACIPYKSSEFKKLGYVIYYDHLVEAVKEYNSSIRSSITEF